MSTIPTATISRLVLYLRTLEQLEAAGVKTTSSDFLADEAQSTAFQVRKDLAYFGRFGTRGAGYTVPTLRRELRRILGLTRAWSVVVIGMGRLGQAIIHDPHIGDYSFEFKGVFDISPKVIGQRFRDLEVQPMSELARVVKEKGVDMALLCTPSQGAQDAADEVVRSGVRGILNFTPFVLSVPSEVHVERMDFMTGLQRLSFYILNPQLAEELG